MKVKVSTQMLKLIKAHVPTSYKLTMESLDIETYRRCVDFDIYRNESDFDSKTNQFKVIKIVYPDDCYACPKFITTRDLLSCARLAKGDYNEFLYQLKSMCEI